ncbi:MAG: isopentenyl-diphosphate delta-isomerase [Bacteroidetes bacterium 4572_77]|nr:MAG: isopentenyl-diphosphate delta-isomerase [Bacteroidetes bacterium 4572_77]
MEKVILVDENDNFINVMEKMEAHRKGLLHRAFSAFIYNDKGEILLQRRALSKYHSGGLWANTCCSHPRYGENIYDAVKRRLGEEMGFSCEIEEIFKFEYRAVLDNDLVEHELDHVFIGKYNGKIEFNPDEVMEYKWISYYELLEDVRKNSKNYTEWFKIILNTFEKEKLYDFFIF